jgi:uncharacterized membrane protein YcaP (DUF421 family)
VEPILDSLFDMGIPVVEKILRTVVVLLFILVGLRMLGKRELGQWNPTDLIIILLLSNAVEEAIIGDDQSLIGGLIGAAVLLAMNHVLVKASFYNRPARRVIEGTPDDLIREGHVDADALAKNQVTREELAAAARRQGIENLAHVRHARLELDGDITFYLKEEYDAAAMAKRIEERLERIEKAMTAAGAAGR